MRNRITSKAPLSVTVSGRADTRLDGVMAARMDSDTLVSRLLNGAIALETDTTGHGAKPVTFTYRPPAPVRVLEEA